MNEPHEEHEGEAQAENRSATAGRFKTFRRSALALVIAAGLTIATVAIVHEVQLAPRRVALHDVSKVPGPLQVAANESIPASAPLKAAETVVEDTADFAFSFAQSLRSARAEWSKKKPSNVTAVADECLSAWANENLPGYAGTSLYEVIDVCGRPTAIVVGASGVDDRVLVYSAIQKGVPANVERVRAVLVESKSSQMAFVSVRSSDSSVVLMAAAALPELAVTQEAATAEGSKGVPPIVNIRPPGVEIVTED